MDTNYKPMFTGNEKGIELTPDEARKKVRKFNCNRRKNDVKAVYFSQAVLRKILSQNGDIVGLRVYYGMNEMSDLDAIIVGVNAKGDNVFKGQFSNMGDKDANSNESGIYSSNNWCPSRCPTSSTDFS
jgi:hypothetical protein